MEVCWVMAIGDRGRLRPVVGGLYRKAISGGERGSPGQAVQAGIRGIEIKVADWQHVGA